MFVVCCFVVVVVFQLGFNTNKFLKGIVSHIYWENFLHGFISTTYYYVLQFSHLHSLNFRTCTTHFLFAAQSHQQSFT